jgi:prepilin-type N-terminal cleavage/methylation domain-containing protein
MSNNDTRAGFTLVELIIVVVVLVAIGYGVRGCVFKPKPDNKSPSQQTTAMKSEPETIEDPLITLDGFETLGFIGIPEVEVSVGELQFDGIVVRRSLRIAKAGAQSGRISIEETDIPKLVEACTRILALENNPTKFTKFTMTCALGEGGNLKVMSSDGKLIYGIQFDTVLSILQRNDVQQLRGFAMKAIEVLNRVVVPM